MGSRSGAELWLLAQTKLKQVGMLGNRPEGTKVLDSAYWPEFFGPDHPATVGKGNVQYLTPEKLAQHKITFSDNKIVVPAKNVFKLGITQSTKGDVIFAVDADRGFYIGIKDIHSLKRFHHSSFLAGRPVLGAGTIVLAGDFVIKEVNNHSGHYKPGLKEMKEVARTIQSSGGNLSHITFRVDQDTCDGVALLNK